MKERSIIFNAHDVRAILDGRKTQARRIVKPQPLEGVKVDSTWIRPFVKGQRLWVRENWAWYPLDEDASCVIWRADYEPGAPAPYEFSAWRSSANMPRWASRILLEVTAVRVQRLQDISENEAIAEGVEPVIIGEGWRHYCKDWRDELVGIPPCSTARESFEKLWQSAHGPDSWDQNPWVWAIEFRRIEP